MNPRLKHVAPSFCIVTLLAISSVFAAGERNNFDPQQFSTGKFDGCSPTGEGGDPYLNSLKNARILSIGSTAAFQTLPRPTDHTRRKRLTAQ
jgi:hypothetical protein